jgi:NAD(P)-dependent dehydrogenase (short-subunit alcohol dehydrogenase family)
VDEKRFAGKVALVTGAARGQGAAEALRLAAEGATVIGCDVHSDAEIGGGVSYARLDVTSRADWRRVVDQVLADQGRLDVLINNAGIGVMENLATVTEQDWSAVMSVNLDGAMIGMQTCAPAIRDSGGGAIVNTASAAAFYGSKSLAAYGTSKAALVALTRSVATAYGDRGIRCNAVAPGVVVDRAAQDTLGGPMGDRLRRYTTSHLVGRLGYPEEIAAAVAYLASDEAAFVTGETLRIDGGMTAHGPGRVDD